MRLNMLHEVKELNDKEVFNDIGMHYLMTDSKAWADWADQHNEYNMFATPEVISTQGFDGVVQVKIKYVRVIVNYLRELNKAIINDNQEYYFFRVNKALYLFEKILKHMNENKATTLSYQVDTESKYAFEK